MAGPDDAARRPGFGTEDLLAAPAGEPGGAGHRDGAENGPDPLLAPGEVTELRDRWQSVQTGFVDDPRQAVREADELVATTIRSLAATFAGHRRDLERQWSEGDAATEELRLVLRRYRSFFERLLER
ncbi:hypothetical protein B0I33_11562 [Prauserella shujinwangii]|uniref:Uncharacterized protein n=1 Tax=Prauserella shujinwangii TaxID=1453103 RepID=A0A2T0LKM5_9PSEU|nr:hypothetical protein [Prauserella shujinwangii]PRX43444.1 hypothetical protein B0I33_11562 [Prauserella shujinwangii]